MTSVRAFGVTSSILAVLLNVSVARCEQSVVRPVAESTVGLVDDAELATVRGRYEPSSPSAHLALPSPSIAVPGFGSRAIAAEMSPSGAAFAPVTTIASATASSPPTAELGLTLNSSWQTASGAAYTAGLSLLVDPSAPSAPSITSWSSHTDGSSASATLAAVNSVSGAPLPVSGVAQSVQIAGDGNAAVNHADITLVNGPIVLPVSPTGSTCGSACTITAGNGSVGVAVSLPQGSASQMVGPAGVAQSVAIGTDANAVFNTLHLQIQTSAIHPGPSSLQALYPSLLTGLTVH